jgi:hypothetical protein
MAGNLRFGYRYGQTTRDIVTLDMIYTTGDKDTLSDGKYSGVITGNTWGSPAAIFISSGSYLLFPHGNVVNRYIAAVADLSNLGLGVVGGTFNLEKSIIPNKWSIKLGAAAAWSQFKSPKGGRFMGKELNLRIGYRPKVFMDVEIHAAYLWLGKFYDSSKVNSGMEKRPYNPWTVFMDLKWLMF